ncbi:MAG: LLM class flavin-dependent oxidoreductase [Solirubrobacterales bacterium]|nr:LLM class flavin-dependent oxidoreductase [Solirubrobacterales bacterium]
MGIVESVRGVLWARKRQPDEVAYGLALGHERFSPSQLLEQAVAGEKAGFDAICCSDHLAPWWSPEQGPPASCGNAWVWLGAAGHATERVSLGPAVTALVHRYNPVVVAQQVATLEQLYPGRAFLGVGSGEAMNEVPAGMRWPSVGEQLGRTEEALTIVTRLLDGETVTFQGRYFKTESARLYLESARRPPVYMGVWSRGGGDRRKTCRRLVDLGRSAAGASRDRRLPAGSPGGRSGARRDHSAGNGLVGARRRRGARGSARVEGHAGRGELHRACLRPRRGRVEGQRRLGQEVQDDGSHLVGPLPARPQD